MNTKFRKIFFIVCVVCWGLLFHSEIARSEDSKKIPRDGLHSRIDFGNAYIMGQTIKSGAVYLMQRKQSDIQSMLTYRENYRDEIIENFVGKNSVEYNKKQSK